MKVSKRVVWRAAAALLAVLLAGILAGGAAAADLAEPLSGDYALLAKSRIVLTLSASEKAGYGTPEYLLSGIGNDGSITPPSSPPQLIGTAGDGRNGQDVVECVSVSAYKGDENAATFYGSSLPAKTVVAHAYLIKTSGDSTNTKYDIVFDAMDNKGGVEGRELVSDEPVVCSTRIFGYSGRGSYFSFVANDWNDDGWSDYIVSYQTFDGIPGDASSSGTFNVKSLYIDGKTQTLTNETLYSNTTYGNTAFNTSTAVGDLDCDGTKEFIINYSTYMNSWERPSRVMVYNIVPQSDNSVRFSERWGDDNSDHVGYGWWNDILAVTAGDFDGDGKDQIATVYSRYAHRGSSAGDMWLSLSNAAGTGMDNAVKIISNGPTIYWSRLTMLTGDLDSDGRDELIWELPTGTDVENLHIHTWPSGVATADSSKMYSYKNMTPGGVTSTNSTLSHAVAIVPYDVTPGKHRDLLALSNYGPLRVARWDSGSGVQEVYHIDNYLTDNMASSSWINLTAADLYQESQLLGEPIQFIISAQAKPQTIIQAPPKHWDIISGDKGDASGNVIADAFAQLSASLTASKGYEVDFTSSGTTTNTTTTTNKSSFSTGESTSLTVTAGAAAAKTGISLSVNAAQSKMDEHTNTDTKTTTVSYTAAVHDDDQVYYTETDYTLWRYPILWPKGSSGKQQFVQYLVPTYVDSSVVSTPGRNVSWYQPLFDTYNLFTYPRSLNESVGYPKGNNTADSAWAGLNGKLLFSFGENILVGNGDPTSVTVTNASDVKATDTHETSNTMSVAESDTESYNFGVVNGKYSIGFKQDLASSAATVGTKDVSNLSTITLIWPGGSSYKSPGNYTLQDQQFRISGGAYTQDDGTLRVSFAVPQLLNMEDSNLWGNKSPYVTTPDPGLLLPWRVTWYNNEVVTNTAPNAAKIRGVNFSNYAYDAIPTGQTESVTFRIFNYSFVNAPAFTYDVYYQTKNSSTDLPDLSKAMQQEHVISNGTVPIIYGRSDEPDAPPNWHDAPFQWTTPSNAEQGYLHIVLHPAGQQLSTANDYGYIEVGIFDANQLLGGASGANALSANSLGANSLSANSLSARAIARENLETKGELTIESLKVTDEDGKELEDPLPLHKPFEVAVTVRLDGLEGSGLPAVLVNLYVNGSPVGSQHIPYLAGGDRRTITMTYDPRDHAGVVPSLENLTVRVFSAVTGFVRGGEEADPLSHVAERKFITFGGGGCDAGLAGGLAIFGALGAALLAWKKRK